MYAELHLRLFRSAVGCVVFYCVEDCRKLIAQEHRNDCGGSFVCSESVVVSGRCDRQTKQILIVVNRFDYRTEEKKELCVLVRSFAGSKEVDAGVGRHRPVIVLAGTVHTGKGLFVEQAYKTVLCGDLLHYLHCELVMVGGDVCR